MEIGKHLRIRSLSLSYSNVLRGLPFNSSATTSRYSSVYWDRSVAFGKYCRSKPLVFSFVPRCQGE